MSTDRFEQIERAPHTALAGVVRRYCGYDHVCGGATRRREVAQDEVTIILSLGPLLRVGGPDHPAGTGRPDQVALARLLQRRRHPRHGRHVVDRHRRLTRLHPHDDPGRRGSLRTGAAAHADLRWVRGGGAEAPPLLQRQPDRLAALGALRVGRALAGRPFDGHGLLARARHGEVTGLAWIACAVAPAGTCESRCGTPRCPWLSVP